MVASQQVLEPQRDASDALQPRPFTVKKRPVSAWNAAWQVPNRQCWRQLAMRLASCKAPEHADASRRGWTRLTRNFRRRSEGLCAANCAACDYMDRAGRERRIAFA